MNRPTALLAYTLLTVAPGCSRWAYGPAWKGSVAEPAARAVFDGTTRCGDLSITNRTEAPMTIAWEGIRVDLPGGGQRKTESWAPAGEQPLKGPQTLAPGATLQGGLCADLRMFVVKTRPPTGWDFALGWFFGTGILAGNVAWDPKPARIDRNVPQPKTLGWDLIIPIKSPQGERDLVVDVRGDHGMAFKYTDWAHGEPEGFDKVQRRGGRD